MQTAIEPGEVARFDEKPKGIFEVSDEEYPKAMEELRVLAEEIKAHDQPEWEQRFDEVLAKCEFRKINTPPYVKRDYKPLKEFIRQLLKEQRLKDSIEPEEV